MFSLLFLQQMLSLRVFIFLHSLTISAMPLLVSSAVRRWWTCLSLLVAWSCSPLDPFFSNRPPRTVLPFYTAFTKHGENLQGIYKEVLLLTPTLAVTKRDCQTNAVLSSAHTQHTQTTLFVAHMQGSIRVHVCVCACVLELMYSIRSIFP